MLSRKIQSSFTILALAGLTAGLAGCHEVRRPQGGSALLDGGNDPVKVSARQAADVHIALGRSMEQQGDMEGAIKAYNEALRKDSKRADAYNRLAIINDRQGKFRESADLYQKALDLSPGNAELFADKGYSLYLQRRWAEAEMNLKQAVVLKPSLGRAHNNLGLVLAHDRRVEEALAEFQKSGLSEADAHVNVAFALALENQSDEARQHYETALALNPNSEAARLGLGDLNRALASVAGNENHTMVANRNNTTPTGDNAITPVSRTATIVAPTAVVPTAVAAPAPVRPRASAPALTPVQAPIPSIQPVRPAAAPPLEEALPPLPPAAQRTSAQPTPSYSASFGQVPAKRGLAVGDTAVRVTSGAPAPVRR